MKTFGRNENYRVVIEPRRLGDLGSARVPDSWMASDEAQRQRMYKERCDDIAADVRRHADNVGSICVECDTIHVCSHCGREWTEAGKDYNECTGASKRKSRQFAISLVDDIRTNRGIDKKGNPTAARAAGE